MQPNMPTMVKTTIMSAFIKKIKDLRDGLNAML